ncbi:glycerol-3-phosphate dehydrogenase, partial [bacterium]|nr:glycerol-3-phosphate dehydrogenase [bacterium]
MKNVCVLGAGAWGTAVANLLADNGYNVSLWCYESEVASLILKNRCNERYLPEIILHKNIQAVTSLEKAFKNTQWIFEAVPVQFLRSIVQQCRPFYTVEQTWVVLSKGIESDTLQFPGAIIDDVFECAVKKIVLGGPSFAKDLATRQVTAVTIASEHKEQAEKLQSMLNNSYFCSTVSDDFLGVQLGGALKN